MTTVSRLATALLLSGLASAQAADCSRQDIDHYLDRGFTPQQVLELCRPAPAGAEQATRTPTQELDLQSELRDLIDGFGIVLDENHLLFSRELCIAYDRPNYAEQRKKACGEAHYRIARQGLQVLSASSKLLFWGRDSVKVASPQITRRFELGQDDLSARDQAKLAEALEQGDQLEIPVREGVAPGQLQLRLQKLVKPAPLGD